MKSISQTPAPSPSARWMAVPFCVSIVSLLFLISPNWKADQDSVAYLSMARSLAAGRGMLHLGLHQWHYAPLYSVVISPAFYLGTKTFLTISLINVATAWLLVLGTYLWSQKYFLNGAWIISALVGINIGLWDVCREPRSDTLFSAMLIWTAVCFAKAADACTARNFFAFTLLGTALSVLTVCTRQVGIFLPAGFVLAVMIRWLKYGVFPSRVMIAIAAGILPSIAVIALIAHDHAAAKLDHAAVVVTYAEQYRQPGVSFAAQILDGVRRQTADVGRLLVPGMWGSFSHYGQWFNFNSIFYAAFSLPVIWGWWRITQRTCDPLLWTVPFYAAMFIVWPFDQGTRFNVPMLPVLWVSVWTVLDRWPAKRSQIMGWIFILHLTAGTVYLVRDVLIVNRWNQQIPVMAHLAQNITDNNKVASLGDSPNDLLIWRFLLDRPVIAVPSLNAMQLSGAQWGLLSSSLSTPVGYRTVARSQIHLLVERAPINR